MKLSMDAVWTITKDHIKILEAAETFIKTHNFVPIQMISNKSKIKANFNEYLKDLIKAQFIQNYGNTFKLSLSGYDCLAIKTLREMGLQMIGSNIGIGKESDIYNGTFKGKDVAIKIHRLGRSSYTKVDERNLKNKDNWFLANNENARNEAEFLKLFCCEAVPKYYACNRHIVVMEYLGAYEPLYNVKVVHPEIISKKMFDFILKMWNIGYVHGDLNEFNVMVSNEDIKVIDFPQCVARTDPKAIHYLKRDIECVHKFFWKKNFYLCDDSMFNTIFESTDIKINVQKNGFEIRNKNSD